MTNEKILREQEAELAAKREHKEKRLLVAAIMTLQGDHDTREVIALADQLIRMNEEYEAPV